MQMTFTQPSSYEKKRNDFTCNDNSHRLISRIKFNANEELFYIRCCAYIPSTSQGIEKQLRILESAAATQGVKYIDNIYGTSRIHKRTQREFFFFFITFSSTSLRNNPIVAFNFTVEPR